MSLKQPWKTSHQCSSHRRSPFENSMEKRYRCYHNLRCPNLCNVYCNTVEHMQTQIISCQWTFFISLISARKLKMNKNHYVTFLCPRDDSQGALRFAPVCPFICLSVHPFVTLCGIEFLVIYSSHSFQCIFLKPCIPVVDILKMCMWIFDGARINIDRITTF